MTGRKLTRGRPLVIAAVAIAAVALIAAGAYVLNDDTESDAKATGPAPQTVKKLMWGPPFLADNTPLWPTYRDLGVGIFGVQARWEEIAPDRRPADPTDPKDPAYEWPQYLTDSIRKAQRNGMKVQLLLMGTPRWANGGQSWNWIPNDPQDFGDFATAISRRYPSVDLWMIWGEPNREPNFSPLTPAPEQIEPDDPLNEDQQIAPRNYAVMLDSAYEALKREGPSDQVIGGNTYTSAGSDNIRPYQWIEYMKLPDGSRPRMDMWGHNPWQDRRPDLTHPPSRNGTVSFSDLERLADALDAAGFPGRPVEALSRRMGRRYGLRGRGPATGAGRGSGRQVDPRGLRDRGVETHLYARVDPSHRHRAELHRPPHRRRRGEDKLRNVQAVGLA